MADNGRYLRWNMTATIQCADGMVSIETFAITMRGVFARNLSTVAGRNEAANLLGTMPTVAAPNVETRFPRSGVFILMADPSVAEHMAAAMDALHRRDRAGEIRNRIAADRNQPGMIGELDNQQSQNDRDLSLFHRLVNLRSIVVTDRRGVYDRALFEHTFAVEWHFNPPAQQQQQAQNH